MNNNDIHMVKAAIHLQFKRAMEASDISADYYFKKAKFKKAGKRISEEKAASISQLVSNHPYYMQKFCFFLYEEIDKEVTQKDMVEVNQVVMESERIVFESILQGLTTKQITLLSALAREPTAKVYATTWFSQDILGSIGERQHSLDSLYKKDLIEKNHKTVALVVVVPVFKNWLITLSI